MCGQVAVFSVATRGGRFQCLLQRWLVVLKVIDWLCGYRLPRQPTDGRDRGLRPNEAVRWRGWEQVRQALCHRTGESAPLCTDQAFGVVVWLLLYRPAEAGAGPPPGRLLPGDH